MRLPILAALAAAALCIAVEAQTPPPQADFTHVIAAPPLKHSKIDDADRRIFLATRKLKDSPRWALALQDVNLKMPQMANDTFSCALGAPITQEHTPHLSALLLRTMYITGGATSKPKKLYERPRPFAVYPKAPICAPLENSKSPSYPSGHAAASWGMALVLSEIAPDRAAQILERGRAFGESRVFCGVHWMSDIAPGRDLAAGVIAAAHADPQFVAEIATARAEVAAVRASGAPPTRDCAMDAAALATPIPER